MTTVVLYLIFMCYKKEPENSAWKLCWDEISPVESIRKMSQIRDNKLLFIKSHNVNKWNLHFLIFILFFPAEDVLRRNRSVWHNVRLFKLTTTRSRTAAGRCWTCSSGIYMISCIMSFANTYMYIYNIMYMNNLHTQKWNVHSALNYIYVYRRFYTNWLQSVYRIWLL